MPNLQNLSSEALEQRTSLEGVELTSLASPRSRTTINDDVNTSNQHESIISSTEALDRPLDTEYSGIASQPLPRWSVFEDPWGAWSSRVRNLGLRHGDGKLMSESRDGEQWSTLAENCSNGSLSIDDRPNAAYLFFNNTGMEHELTCRICHSRLAPCRGILSLEAKDSWLPEPADAAQYDIIGAENLKPKASNSFLAESATIGRPIIYPGHAPVNDSLAWSFDPTSLASDAESPDTTLASIFTTSLQVTNGSAATALSTIITILASMAYYDQLPNFAETARDVPTTYYQPFLFPQSFRGFTAVLVVTVIHFLLVVIITSAFITSTRLTTLGDHWQTISQSVSPATEEMLEKCSCATDKEVRQGLKEEHREHEMANLQPLAGGAGRVSVVVARKSQPRCSHNVRLE